jgi:archaellum component FlaC
MLEPPFDKIIKHVNDSFPEAPWRGPFVVSLGDTIEENSKRLDKIKSTVETTERGLEEMWKMWEEVKEDFPRVISLASNVIPEEEGELKEILRKKAQEKLILVLSSLEEFIKHIYDHSGVGEEAP